MINLYLIKVGDKIRLTDGRVGECVDNMGDGQWIEANFFEDNGSKKTPDNLMLN